MSEGLPTTPKDNVTPIEMFVAYSMGHRLVDPNDQPMRMARMHRDYFYLWTHPETYPKVIFVAPRGYYKSSFAEMSICYDILTQPHKIKEHLILGFSDAMAQDRLRAVARELTENDKIVDAYFGGKPPKGEKWTQEQIEVIRTIKDEQGNVLRTNVKVIARGRGGSMRGLHPDSILIDDIEGQRDTGRLSVTDVKNTMDWLKGTVFGMRTSARMRIFLQGNFLGYESLLHKAYEGKDWGSNWYRAKYSARDENGHSIWPERYPDEFLNEQESDMSPLKFMAEYMNQPLASENPLVLREWIRYFEQPDVPPLLFKVLSFDPAQSLKESADYSAFCVVAADVSQVNEERYFVLDAGHGHWDLDTRVRKIIELYRIYQPDIIRIENQAFQNDMVVYLEKESQRLGMHLPIDRVRRGKDGIAKDKFTALDAVSPLLKFGKVLFRKEQIDLIDELLAFPNAQHDDLVDAFTYGVDAMKWRWLSNAQAYARKNYGKRQRVFALAEAGY